MATVITKTLKATGGDYTTMTAWEAAMQSDIVTADESHVLECYNDWPSGLVADTVITGWTTDATHTITITVPESERHNGIPGSGFFLLQPTRWNITLDLGQSYITVEWVDLSGTDTGTNGASLIKVGYTDTSQNNNILNCILKRLGGSNALIGCGGIESAGIVVKNSLFLGTSALTDGIATARFTHGAVLENNTIDVSRNAIILGVESLLTENLIHCNNNVAVSGGVVQDYAGNTTGSNNAAHDTSFSVLSLGTITDVTTAEFVDAANDDYHLASGSQLIGAGVAGVDIGAFEYAASGTTVTPNATTQAQTLDNVTLTQHNVLTVNGLNQSNAIAQPTLSTASQLTVASAVAAQSIDNVTLTQAHVLTVASSAMAQSVANTSLTQHNALTVNAISQGQSADNAQLTQHGTLGTDSLQNSQTVDNVSLNQHNILTSNAINHAQQIDNVSFTVAASLIAQSLSASQIVNTPTLTQAHQLIVTALSNGMTIDVSTLAVAGQIQANSIAQSNQLGLPLINQHNQLSVSGLNNQQLVDLPTLVSHYIVGVNSLLQGNTLSSLSLATNDALAVLGVEQLHTSQQVSLTQYGVLAVNDLSQAQIVELVRFGGGVVGYLEGQLVMYSMIDGEVSITHLLDGVIALN